MRTRATRRRSRWRRTAVSVSPGASSSRTTAVAARAVRGLARAVVRARPVDQEVDARPDRLGERPEQQRHERRDRDRGDRERRDVEVGEIQDEPPDEHDEPDERRERVVDRHRAEEPSLLALEPEAAPWAPVADLEPTREEPSRAAARTSSRGSPQDDGESARRAMTGMRFGALRRRAALLEIVPRSRHLGSAYDRVAACRR